MAALCRSGFIRDGVRREAGPIADGVRSYAEVGSPDDANGVRGSRAWPAPTGAHLVGAGHACDRPGAEASPVTPIREQARSYEEHPRLACRSELAREPRLIGKKKTRPEPRSTKAVAHGSGHGSGRPPERARRHKGCPVECRAVHQRREPANLMGEGPPACNNA